MKKLILISILVLSFLNLSAQTENDAIRYASTNLTGTARALGMGGAFSAVGADMTAASTNPAGLGLYQFSDFTITPTFRLVNNNASFLGNKTSDTQTPFTFANMGYTYHAKTERQDEETGLKGITFGIGYNQLDNYSRGFYTAANNAHSSLTDFFVQRANGISPANLDSNSYAGLAYNAYLIDIQEGSANQYYPIVNNGNIYQTVNLAQNGRKNEWFISLAGNWSDKFYIGGTLGIQSLKYAQTLKITEEDRNDVHNSWQANPNNGQFEAPANKIVFQDEYATKGTGINVQAGIIYRPTQNFRLGISFKSPTALTMEDNFQTIMQNTLDDSALQYNGQYVNYLESKTPTGTFNYTLTTPYIITAGAMYMFGTHGFISSDIEITDYKTAKYKPTDDIFRTSNALIQQYTNMGINYRVGGELRMNAFRIRAGGALYGSVVKKELLTYQNATNINENIAISPNRQMLTLGVGIRKKDYYLDIALVNQRQMEKFDPYTLTSQNAFTPSIVDKKVSNSIVATLGFSF